VLLTVKSLPNSKKALATETNTENTEEIFFRVLRVPFSVAFPLAFGFGFAAPGNSWQKKFP
jgi:hypothetical protein